MIETTLNGREVEDFIDGYIEAMLWANGYNVFHETEDLTSISTCITAAATRQMREDCNNFLTLELDEEGTVIADLISTVKYYQGAAAYAGHDFALSRNGHGAGFWDRGSGEAGDILHKWAKTFGSANLYVTDTGKVEHE